MLLVYLFHYGGGLSSPHPVLRLFGYLTQLGWTGVELFFVLSGFLITGLLWPHPQQSDGLQSFLARRAWRILPVYYAALLAAILAAAAAGGSLESLQPILVYLAFLQNIPPLVATALHSPPPVPLYHLWTVAVEVQFYLLWPLLLRAAGTRRRALALCAGAFAASCLFRVAVFLPHGHTAAPAPDWSPFLLTRLGALALGSSLALLEPAQLTSLLRRGSRPALLLSACVIASVGWAGGDLLLSHPSQFILSLPAVEIACAVLLGLALRPGPWRSTCSLRPLRWLGRISYGFYLLHILLEPLFDRIGLTVAHADTGSLYIVVRFIVAFPVSAALAWLSFRYLELPLLRRRPAPRSAPSLSCIQSA